MESSNMFCEETYGHVHTGTYRKGPWTPEEDRQLIQYMSLYGEGPWDVIAKATGLKRNGKSCRLRWVNYLRPNLKRTKITADEAQVIIDLHKRWGNSWSRIAKYLPGRTDNDVKNYFRNYLRRKMRKNKKRGNENSVARSANEVSRKDIISDFNGEIIHCNNEIREFRYCLKCLDGCTPEESLDDNLLDGFQRIFLFDYFGDGLVNEGALSLDSLPCSQDTDTCSSGNSFIDYTDQLWNIDDVGMAKSY